MPEVERVVGRYEIVGRIGRGGMGIVHLARQPGLDRLVALKEFVAVDTEDTTFAERFVREARIVGALNHPNIVTVFDYFEENGRAFIAMEYLERGSLLPLVGRLDTAQIVGVLEGVLGGLAHAHDEGIVHRDLKPANLLVGKRGAIKIADFGISKALNLLGSQSLTATGLAVGSPSYMSPEQALANEIGPWTDLYSLGVIAYELLVGRLPFGGTDTPMAILFKHVHEPVPPPLAVKPDLDPRLAAWLERLLAKPPSHRPQSAPEAWDELEEIAVALLGERWRRQASLPDAGEAAAAASPAGAETPPEPATAQPEVEAYATYVPPSPPPPADARAEPPPVEPAPPPPPPAPPPRPAQETPTLAPSPAQPPRAGGGPRRRWIAAAVAIALLAAAVAGVLVWRGGGSSSTTVETFSDPTDSWFVPFRDEEAVAAVRDGAYLVRTVGEEGSFPVVVDDFDPQTKDELTETSPLPAGDARLTMEATKIAGPEENQFGLACRENGPADEATYYYLGISSDGHAYIEKYADGEVEELRDWQETAAVKDVTETNQLVAECRGGKGGAPVALELRVNGREVARATDPKGVPVTFFGFFVGSDAPGLELRVDNFSLERL